MSLTLFQPKFTAIKTPQIKSVSRGNLLDSNVTNIINAHEINTIIDGSVVNLVEEFKKLKDEVKILREQINDIEMRPPNVGGLLYQQAEMDFNNKI